MFIVRGSAFGGFDVDCGCYGQICGNFDSCMIITWLLRKETKRKELKRKLCLDV